MDKPRKNIEYFRFRDLEHYEKDIQKERKMESGKSMTPEVNY